MIYKIKITPIEQDSDQKSKFLSMINRLEEIARKKGSTYAKNLLTKNVVISEKLDTHRIQFEKIDGELKFFTKDNKEIDRIVRTVSDLWETALVELPILIENAGIPEGHRFGMCYTPTERPQRIPYSRIPKYILTDVTKRDRNNKIISALDFDEVNEWSGKLCVGRPPIIFEGELSENEANEIFSYAMKEFSDNNESLVKLVNRLFTSSYSKEPIIEGIVIQSGPNLMQVISYEFDILNESYNKEPASRDFYDLIMISLTSFMKNYSLPIMESASPDQMYLDLVCDVFNRYMENTNFINEGIDPGYLTPTSFGEIKTSLNKSFIRNRRTVELLGANTVNESVFRIFLSALKKKKKPYGLLDENFVNEFNTHVELIDSFVNSYDRNRALNEAETNISINAIRQRQPSDIDGMRVISSIQRAFRPMEDETEKSLNPCVVYLTEYRPFTLSQLENVRNMTKQWGCDVILAAVSRSKKRAGSKFRVSDELVKAQMNTIRDFDKDLVAGYILLDSWSLLEVFEYCRPRFEPMAVITDMGKKSELGLQLFFEEEVMGKRLNVDPNFNIGEMENKDELPVIRSIEDENFSNFSELVPPYIKRFYNLIVNEYKLWDGQIIRPSSFKENNFPS